MVLKAVEEVSGEVPADDFQALEDKVYRTIEMYKAAREATAAAERDAQRLRQQLKEREEEAEALVVRPCSCAEIGKKCDAGWRK